VPDPEDETTCTKDGEIWLIADWNVGGGVGVGVGVGVAVGVAVGVGVGELQETIRIHDSKQARAKMRLFFIIDSKIRLEFILNLN
jgi:hypothetical protein